MVEARETEMKGESNMENGKVVGDSFRKVRKECRKEVKKASTEEEVVLQREKQAKKTERKGEREEKGARMEGRERTENT